MKQRGVKMKRINVRISDDLYNKLNKIAERYGTTVNSMIAMVLGQWADTQYNLKEQIIEAIVNKAFEKGFNVNELVEEVKKM